MSQEDDGVSGGAGGAYRRGHTRSASTGGASWAQANITYNPTYSHPVQIQSPTDTSPYKEENPPQASHSAISSILSGPSIGAGTSASLPGHAQRGHQRTFSHGQTVDGITAPHSRGHKRAGSKTDFILPDDHDQRERERAKPQVGRTSSFPIGHRRNTSKTESVYTIRETKISLLQRLFFWRKVRFS